jgi:glycosyltransferase involved in cell wall biosynthesis
MRILQANKFFYNAGGSDVVFLETIKGLKDRGHEVAEFAMQSAKNLPSNYAKYFVSELPAHLLGDTNIISQIKITKRIFYSGEVARKLQKLVRDFKPDVIHLHNVYHHLSASIFTTLKKLGIPIVLTLHDFFPLCPNHNFAYKETFSKEAYQKPYQCFKNKCVNNSYLPSLVGTVEEFYFKARNLWGSVDMFICPSDFMLQSMIDGGFSEKKLIKIVNPIKINTEIPALGNKILFMGRIHREKGIRVLMPALSRLKKYEVIIAGSGPDDEWLDNFITEHKLKNVTRKPWVEGDEWMRVIKQAKVMVFPSIFYENCPKAILEALSFGRLVVASNKGGNPEIIMDKKTGFLCAPENEKDLARAIKEAMDQNEEQASFYIKNGLALLKEKYRSDLYFSSLENLYSNLV